MPQDPERGRGPLPASILNADGTLANNLLILPWALWAAGVTES